MPRRLGTPDAGIGTPVTTHVTVPVWLLALSAAIPVTLLVGLLTGRVQLHGRKTRHS